MVKKFTIIGLLLFVLTGSAFASNFVQEQTGNNTVPVAQQDIITILATAESGDVYTTTINGHDVAYTTDGTDTTLTDIAGHIASAINGDVAVNGAVTATANSNNITIVSDVAGTAYTLNASTTNYPGVAQEDTFEIGGTVEAGDVYTTTINGNDTVYTLDGNEADLTAVINNIVNAINNDANQNGTVVAALVDGTHYKVTAKVAGTPFTTSAGATDGGSTADNTLTVSNTVANDNVGVNDNQVFLHNVTANVVETFETIKVSINGSESFGDSFNLLSSVDGTNTSNKYIISNYSIINNKVTLDELTALFDAVTGISASNNGSVITVTSDDSSKDFSLVLSIENDGNVSTSLLGINTVSMIGDVAVCNYTGAYSVTGYIWKLDGVNIVGATSQSYTIVSGNEGKDLSCVVTLGVADNQVDLYSSVVELADGKITISSGSVFSVPTCVDSEDMKSYANVTSNDVFVTYTTGQWSNYDSSFKPLVGYKYLGSKSFNMPVINSDSCDLSEVKIAIKNDWNLLGVNANSANAGDWLWSLTQRSTGNTFIDALYDISGAKLASYVPATANFGTYSVTRGNAYWVFYAGSDGQVFNGVSN